MFDGAELLVNVSSFCTALAPPTSQWAQKALLVQPSCGYVAFPFWKPKTNMYVAMYGYVTSPFLKPQNHHDSNAVQSIHPLQAMAFPSSFLDPSWRFASTSCIPWSRSSPMIVILGQRRNVWAVYTYNITHIWRKLNLIELYIYIILCVHIYIYIYACIIIEGSLEVKLPTIWTDEKQSREEAQRRERLEERRSEEKE